MSMGALGYYEKSYRLMMLPLQNITHVISPVMHPVFSEMQDDISKLAISYERVIRLLAYIGFPLSIFLYFTSTEITLILFGNQWIKSIAPFQILALSVGIQIIMSTSGLIFQAANDTKSMFSTQKEQSGSIYNKKENKQEIIIEETEEEKKENKNKPIEIKEVVNERKENKSTFLNNEENEEDE
jgi:hypothetical protein